MTDLYERSERDLAATDVALVGPEGATAASQLAWAKLHLNRAVTVVDAAYGDGVTDSAEAFEAAFDAVDDHAEIIVGPGTYLLETIVEIPRPVRLRGVGRPTIVVGGSTNGAFWSQVDVSGLLVEGFRFDLTVTSNDNVVGLAFYGTAHTNRDLAVLGCEFLNERNVGVYIDGSDGARVVGNRFWSPSGRHPGAAVAMLNSVGYVVADNDMDCQGVRCAVTADEATDPALRDGRVSRNRINGRWQSAKWTFAGSGAGVTYTDTVLTDTGASFTGLTTVGNQGSSWLRVMQQVSTGTATAATSRTLTDSSANFPTTVTRGFVVRTADRWAKVERRVSATKLVVRDWRPLDLDTWGTPTAPPATSTAYTLYEPVFGRVDAFTSTTITTYNWFTLDGSIVTPNAGDRYEVITSPNYGGFGIQHSTGSQRTIIDGNHVEETWVEAIYYCGADGLITGNNVQDGQDMGITISDTGQTGEVGRTVVAANRIDHMAGAGIALEADDNIADGNVVSGCGWRGSLNADATSQTFQVAVRIDGDDNVVCGLVALGGMSTVMRHAVKVHAGSGTVTEAISGVGLTGADVA